MIEGHTMPDHIHMCLSIPPKYSVSTVIDINVSSMEKMFFGATSFTMDISEWSDHVAETVSHEKFSEGTSNPLPTAYHPYASWDN